MAWVSPPRSLRFHAAVLAETMVRRDLASLVRPVPRRHSLRLAFGKMAVPPSLLGQSPPSLWRSGSNRRALRPFSMAASHLDQAFPPGTEPAPDLEAVRV